MDPNHAETRAEEIAAVVEEIRRRVRARNPNGAVLGDIPIPDLLPLVHARDAAEGKVAAIGTVNPRPPGTLNSVVQTIKRQVARALNWHVREQVNFNRAVLGCMHSTIEALAETNRVIVALAGRIQQNAEAAHAEAAVLREEATELKDIRTHWSTWRETWERKLSDNEIHFFRSLSDLQAHFQHRVTLLEAAFREQVKSQHTDYEAALARSNRDLQERLWKDLENIRLQYESIIHAEIRLLRQRTAVAQAAEAVIATIPERDGIAGIDWLKFAEKFRGDEETIRQRQQMYASRFQGRRQVLDVGCGRGELLAVLKESGIGAHGIDLSNECVAMCRSKGLSAERADLFTYLREQPAAAFDGIVSSQVLEHLPPERLPEFVNLCHEKLASGGLLAIETPNPECLAIFATHFYLDPTHQRPIPPPLLAFYLEEAGFGLIEVERLSPARESIPSVANLPEDFEKQFFGGMDYAIFGRKLSSS